MQFEAGAFKPLHLQPLLVDQIGDGRSEGQTKEGQTFRVAEAGLAIQFDAVGTPGAQEGFTHVLLGLGEEATAGGGPTVDRPAPTAALTVLDFNAEVTEQDIVGRRVVGVEFEAVAFEPLHLHGLSFDHFLALCGDGEAKDGQTAVLLPEGAEAPVDTEAGFGKAAGLRGGGGLGSPRQGEEGQQQDEAGELVHYRFLSCAAGPGFSWKMTLSTSGRVHFSACPSHRQV